MNDFEDYAVHREGLADAAQPDTWTRGPLPRDARAAADLTAKDLMAGRPIPLVLTIDGETAVALADADTPVPFGLTPAGEAAAGYRGFFTNPSPSYLASIAAEHAERAPEAGS